MVARSPKVPTLRPCQVEPTASQQSSISHRSCLRANSVTAVEIERIAQRVGQDQGSRAPAEGGFELADIYVVGGQRHVHEYRHQAVLQDGIHRGGKAGRDGDHFIAGNQASMAQLGRGQCGHRQQVGRRSRIHQQAIAQAAPTGELALELVGEAARRQPEIECRIYERAHFRGVEDLAGDGHLGGAGDEVARRESRGAILAHEIENLARRSSLQSVMPGTPGTRRWCAPGLLRD